jgi:wyosine [tRNA(Phe)-imidazoG37] synthetase (radical SAM superfamily)
MMHFSAKLCSAMKSNHSPTGSKADTQPSNWRASPERTRKVTPLARFKRETEFGYKVGFQENRFVSAVLSQRAGGLSIEANINPEARTNFDCLPKISGQGPLQNRQRDMKAMLSELKDALTAIYSGCLRDQPWCHKQSDELLKLQHVALSGDSEPTLCPNFFDTVKAMMDIRASGRFPFFKIMLSTNGSRLDHGQVQPALKLFTRRDEIWVKLNAGTQYHMNLIDRLNTPLEAILKNILCIARERPVVIQSMFPQIQGEEPPLEEIMYYVQRLKELKARGAQISLVQVYSAHQSMNSGFGHLSLKVLSYIAQSVRNLTGLKAEIF